MSKVSRRKSPYLSLSQYIKQKIKVNLIEF